MESCSTHYLTLQHMTIPAIRSTCVLSHTWELEHTAWLGTQTALPRTHDENVSIITSLCHQYALYILSHHLSFKTQIFVPLFHAHTRHIFQYFRSTSISLSSSSLHMHTPAVLTSTVGIEVATICSLMRTLTRLPPWVRITKLPRTMVQWEVTLPLVGWEGQLGMWGETGIEVEVARCITLTGANWFVIMLN